MRSPATWRPTNTLANAAPGLIDFFVAAEPNKLDVAILSAAIRAEVRGLLPCNLASEMLRKLRERDIETCGRRQIRAIETT